MKILNQFIVVLLLFLFSCSKDLPTGSEGENTSLGSDQQISFAKHGCENKLLVFRTKQSPVIDGRQDGPWRHVPEIRFNQVFDITGPLDGQRDLSGYFKMMWDDDNLYLLVEVLDDEIDVSSPNFWENDCIQIFFDGDNSKNVYSECPSDFPGGYDENDYQITAVFGQNPVQAARVPGQVDLSALDFKYRKRHGGYTIEAALPFNALLAPLEVTATKGYRFGFELVVNDRDSGEWQNGLKWTTSQDQCGYLNPSEWGTAILVGEHSH